MKSRLAIGFMLLAVLALPYQAPAEETKPSENLPQLVDAALANNPEVKASEARWEMFRNRVAQAGALDDPMLMLKMQSFLIRDPFNSRRDPMSQRVIGISQQLPFWGKRDLKAEVASREAEALKWQVAERKLELARMVKETWYQIFLTDKELQIVEKNIRIMDDFIALAETKYSVGQGAQQDVFKAQVERSKMVDMKISLEQQRKSLQATLNTLLYRPAETPVGKVADFELKPFTWSPDQLRSMAQENRPLVKSLRAEIEKGEAGHRLAEKEYFPDVNLSFEYMQRDPINDMEAGYDMYSAGLTFNLPIQRERRHAMVRESSAEIAMATAELNTLNNSINLGIADSLAQLERREKLAKLYRTGIIPQAEQSLESATIGYRVNKVDFLTLLDNRLTLFNYERDYYESLAEYQMRLAQLEALVGKELQE
ncbi:outer membrane efflux protein [Geobacter metallireducens RCH3]|uniref:Metal ion efflux pump, RND family, outer membrane protein n=1 Tax=Geobacter metallireducens (strain ATCC 53774 / DSM 7210 / GS-15) TaxID=269799 RepID=Q39VE1_GEOMG|nr:TolC family protein [Geobacter metallireducens]ABB31783.1 metal ion efflux pump, RND family, outer membrane protein [Geobacter metallireducens GS-15]EHP89338.1 outer membrane efflux protein [Geobacter metallireducens RCH3]